MQALNDADETVDLLAYAAADPRVAGVVGWIDLAAPDVEDLLGALREGRHGQLLVGIRHLALIEDDPDGWLSSGSVQRGLAAVGRAGLPYDLIFRPEHLEAVLQTVRTHTEVSVHPRPPGQATDRVERGRGLGGRHPSAGRGAERDVQALRQFTVAASGWTVADLHPYANVALDAFGADRVMFGSDWPVSLLAAPYDEGVVVVEQLLSGCTSPERDQILGETAARVYRIN